MWEDLLNFYEDQEAGEVDSRPIYVKTKVTTLQGVLIYKNCLVVMISF